MAINVEDLHEQILSLPLADLFRLAAEAVDQNLDEERLKIIFTYVEIGLAKRALQKNVRLK